MRFTLLPLFLFIGSTVYADDIRFQPGTTVIASVTLTADASGVLQLNRQKPITIGSVGTTTPIDPVTPNPNPDEVRVKRFRDLAQSINEPKTTQSLQALFQGLSQESDPSSQNPMYKTPGDLQKNLVLGLDLFLMQSQKPDQWKNWRTLVNDEWVLIAKQGGTIADYSKLMNDISTGLWQANGSKAEAFDIQLIFQILQILENDNLTWLQKIVQAGPLLIKLFA